MRTGVERHGTHDDRRASLEESSRSLLLGDARESVEDAGVVAALLQRERGISLHADQGQIGRGADDGTETTGDETADCLPTKQRARYEPSRSESRIAGAERRGALRSRRRHTRALLTFSQKVDGRVFSMVSIMDRNMPRRAVV